MSRRLLPPVLTSVVSLFVSMGLQFILPATMLSRWGSAGYSLVLAVQGFAMYVSIADLGIQAFVTQRIAVYFARGDSADARAMAGSALKTLTILATAGFAAVNIAFALLGSGARHTIASRAGVGVGALSAAFAAQTAAMAVSVALSGWSTCVETGTGHYQRAQIWGMSRSCTSAAVLVSMALARQTPVRALVAQACTLVSLDVVRITVARRLLPAHGPELASPSALRLLSAARGSLVLAFAGATQNGLQPAVIAILSANAAAAAVPARTIANAARTLAMAVSNVLWVPLAAKLAGYERPADTFHVWRRISPVLALLVLVGVTALLCVVPVVVPIWLPHQSETILRIFSYFAVEQAAFMAAFPSLMLLQALGRFGQLGAWALTTSICGVTLTWMLVPRAGAAGFGIANALVTCVVYAPGLLLSEYLYWHRVGVDARGFLARRGGLCLTTTAACLAYAAHPAVAACFLLAVTSACVWALRPWRLIMAS